MLSTGPVYDAAGNILEDANNQYRYDLEGRLCAVFSSGPTYTQYVYDAGGQRVAKGTLTAFPASGSACAAPIAANNFTLTATYLRGIDSDQDTELDTAANAACPNCWHTNVFAAGETLATYNFNGVSGTAPTLSFNFEDWEGTKRMQSTAAGAVAMHWSSDPFGDYLHPTAIGSATDATENHFTGKERDNESGNDYFGARYYASSMGRWMSPDWSAREEPVPYAKLDDPQTLNLYAYVGNNPLIRIDEDGHDALKIVDPRTGHVTILIPVHMTGRGATKERVHQILQRANHVHSEDPNVTVKVIYTKTPVNGVMNTLDISPRQDLGMCPGAGECVNHHGGNKGHIDSRNAGDNDAGPHEIMHFAGANDKYDERVDQNGKRVTPPKPGYNETDLMSNRSGTNLKPAETREMQQNPTTKQ